MARQEVGAQHPCLWLHTFPCKSEEQGQDYLEHWGQPRSPSVLEGVASFLSLLLLCSQHFAVDLLQWVVHIVPIQVPVPLCPGAQEQGHIDPSADQQQEN